MEIDAALEELVLEHSFVCGAVLALSGEVIARSGKFDELEWGPTLLGPQAYALADGAIRPAMSGQGREFALLERVSCGLVIVFGLDRAAGMEHILFARQVGQSIERLFPA